jgi:hypothetical protein
LPRREADENASPFAFPFSGGNEECYEKPRSGWPVSFLGIELRTSRKQNGSAMFVPNNASHSSRIRMGVLRDGSTCFGIDFMIIQGESFVGLRSGLSNVRALVTMLLHI